MQAGTQEVSHKNEKKLLYDEGEYWNRLPRVVVVFFSRDNQNPPGRCPVQPASLVLLVGRRTTLVGLDDLQRSLPIPTAP